MSPSLRQHGSARGFNQALKLVLKVQEAEGTRTFNELSRAFYLQRFLARVFADPNNRWVLKGGTNLLTRFPEVARYSQDLDLMYLGPQSEGIEFAVDELRRVAGRNADLDPFIFTVHERGAITGGPSGIRVSVTATYGATELITFPIDLVADLPITAQLDQQQPRPVAELDAVAPLPTFTLYPLPDQVADKVCAMYEIHGAMNSPSSRYRDLVDLLIIISHHSLDAALLSQALTKEVTRRSITLPVQLHVPAAAWHGEYPKEARRSALPGGLRNLDSAVDAAARCLDPILDGTTTNGTWDPHEARWTADMDEGHRA